MWSFQKLGAHDSRQQSKLDEFFNSQSASTSLVRESIQNSLDARVEGGAGPVVVRYEFSKASGNVLKKYTAAYDSITLTKHLCSNELGKFKVSNFEEDARCLLVADFNTTGLTGETNHLSGVAKSPFIGFWWQEGISDKKKGSGGSHGVGKTTLSGSSEAHTFLALTKRHTDNREFLIGFSHLPYHMVGGQQYKGCGRFGDEQKDHFEPISDQKKIEEFKKDFAIERGSSGLSVFIPKVLKDITVDSIRKAVIDDYYMAILSNMLRVEIIDNISGNGPVIISADNLKAIALGLSGQDTKTAHKVQFAAEALKLRRTSGEKRFFNGIEPKKDKDGFRLTADSFSTENLVIIRNLYANGEMVGIRIPFTVEPSEGPAKNTHIDVFLKADKETENLKISQYVRNNIIVSEENPGLLSPYSFAMVIADHEDISSYLRLAEEPSHTRWYIGRFKKEGQYKNDWQLRLVKGGLKQLTNVLLGIDESEKEIKSFGADIFWISELTGSGDKSEEGNKKGRDKTPGGEGVENRSKSLISIDKDIDGKGFTIKAVNDFTDILKDENMSLPVSWKLKVAYMIPVKNPFTVYTPFDFDFSNSKSMKINAEGDVNITENDKNVLAFEVTGEDFRITVRGFDGVRDLKLKCKMVITEMEEAA